MNCCPDSRTLEPAPQLLRQRRVLRLDVNQQGSSARRSILAPHPAMPATARNGCGDGAGLRPQSGTYLIDTCLASFPCLLLARPDWGSITGRGAGPSPMTPDSGRDEQEDRAGDDVFRVPEAVVEVPHLGAGRPTCARERERPDDRAGDRQQRAATEHRKTPAGIAMNERTTALRGRPRPPSRRSGRTTPRPDAECAA